MSSLKDKRILVTGGAGLVGSHICDQLVEEGVGEIVVLDNFVRGKPINLAHLLDCGKLKVVEGDICNFELMRDLMSGIDIVFHQSALRITQCAEEPRLAFNVMAQGTFNVLEACVASSIEKIVAASSASVYGMADSFPTVESHHPYNNRTIYGACKTFNEGLLRSFNEMYGLNYVALRYFNIYGPRMSIAGDHIEVMIHWMNRIHQGKPPIIFGDGKQTMDFVYITDVARCNLLAAKSEVSDETFNVGSGHETSLLELAHCLLRVMDSKLSVQHEPERKVNPVPRRLADPKAARDKLGFKSNVSLEEGLSRLVKWWQQQRGVEKIHA